MKIYNTLSKKLETLPDKDNYTIYVCGPTVYDFIHIGNARAIVVFDTLRRFLKKIKRKNVKYIQNFTDVDDKIIKRANDEGIPPLLVSAKYIEEYFIDSYGLGVEDADFHPKVSENISEIIELVSILIKKGFAYETSDGVYFSVEKFKEYGKLSGRDIEEQLENARGITLSENKKDILDFAIWKKAKPDEKLFWDSPFGKGRPGWHIECSAMVRKYAGGTLDIHGGGTDLIFPHHENEIAQSEAAYGECFSRFFMHSEMVLIDGKKLSKSKMTPEQNELFKTRTASKIYGYEPIRLLLLSAGYGKEISYSRKLLDESFDNVKKLHLCRNFLESVPELEGESNYKSVIPEFEKALDSNFNTSLALSILYTFCKNIKKDNPKAVFSAAKSDFKLMCETLGLVYGFKDPKEFLQKETAEIPYEVKLLVEKRKKAREDKDYKTADEIRDEITKLGYALQESRSSVTIIKL